MINIISALLILSITSVQATPVRKKTIPVAKPQLCVLKTLTGAIPQIASENKNNEPSHSATPWFITRTAEHTVMFHRIINKAVKNKKIKKRIIKTLVIKPNGTVTFITQRKLRRKKYLTKHKLGKGNFMLSIEKNDTQEGAIILSGSVNGKQHYLYMDNGILKSSPDKEKATIFTVAIASTSNEKK